LPCDQDVAERLAREAKQRCFAPRVLSMDAFDIKQLPAQQLVIFVASTTGQVRALAFALLVMSAGVNF
jgi:sulfite reductase alpha subunit-like flavoprotein